MLAGLAGHGEAAAPALFAGQVAAVVAAVQVVHRGLLLTLVPLHASAADRFGPRAAVFGASMAVTAVAHLFGVLLTVPAVVGVKVGKIQVNKAATMQQLMRSLPLISLNFLLSWVIGALVTICTTEQRVLLNISLDLPSRTTLAMQTVFALLMTEVWFYHVHRLFHENKRLYALVHKIHHTWPAPVAIVGTYAHPVEHVGCNVASVLFGMALCGAHPTASLAYTLVFAVGAYGHHCGYWTDDMGMHDIHHEVFNVNYGNAHILDYLYGTYRLKGSGGPSKAK